MRRFFLTLGTFLILLMLFRVLNIQADTIPAPLSYEQVISGLDSVSQVETSCRHSFGDNMMQADSNYLESHFNLYKSFTETLNGLIERANGLSYNSDRQKADMKARVMLVETLHTDYAAMLQYALKEYLKRYWIDRLKRFAAEISLLVLKSYIGM